MDDIKYLPLLLALVAMITGAFIGVVVGALAAVLAWSGPFIWGLTTFALVGAGSWLLLLGWWRSLVERINGIERDINPTDGGTFAPVQAETVRVEFRDTTGGDDYPSVWWHDLPGGLMKLRAVALAIEGGAKFSHSLSGPGKALTRGQYEGLRDCLLEHGYLCWKDDRSRKEGVRLTARGAALMRTLAATPAGDLPRFGTRLPNLPIDRLDAKYTQRIQTPKGGDY